MLRCFMSYDQERCIHVCKRPPTLGCGYNEWSGDAVNPGHPKRKRQSPSSKAMLAKVDSHASEVRMRCKPDLVVWNLIIDDVMDDLDRLHNAVRLLLRDTSAHVMHSLG